MGKSVGKKVSWKESLLVILGGGGEESQLSIVPRAHRDCGMNTVVSTLVLRLVSEAKDVVELYNHSSIRFPSADYGSR